MFFHIKVSAKDKKVLENFGQFISKLQLTSNSLQSLSKRNLRKFITVLKSPHVNKTAQEQFESRIYSKQLTIYSSQKFQYLIFLKKIKTHLFPDINIKTGFKIVQDVTKRKEVHNPDNFKIGLFANKNLSVSRTKTKNFIRILDIYGELTKIGTNKFG